MHRILSLFILLLLLVTLPAAVSAQGEVTLERVLVELWPEYDRPEMLVLYRLSLPETTALPVSMTIRIPAEAGDPNAVAELSGDRLVTLEYQRRIAGEWAEIVFTANSAFIQLEYYDPGLTRQGADRDFSYTWAGDYAVENFDLSIQLPVGVPSMQISPQMDGPNAQADGLNYYQNQFGDLAAGESIEVSLAYVKNNDTLTVSALTPVENTGEQPAETSGSGEGLSSLALVGIVLGVVLIAAGLLSNFGMLSFGSSGQESSYRNKKRATRGRRTAGGGFCHNCGNQALSEDKFCRECGTILRS